MNMATGAHPPGEPAVPGDERATAGFPAAAAFPPGHVALLDRKRERGQIDRLLEAARQGRSAALVLQGEPGIGKTTLLDYAVESGGDFEIVRLLGIESETELGFAALHQLLLPFLAGLRSLPAPQLAAHHVPVHEHDWPAVFGSGCFVMDGSGINVDRRHR